MLWIESDLSDRRRFVFDLLRHIRVSLVPSKLIDVYLSKCSDISLKVALSSVKRDLVTRKGSLVTLNAQPRFGAKKNIYVIGGSQRELRSPWTRSECTYDTVEIFDPFTVSLLNSLVIKMGDNYENVIYRKSGLKPIR